MPSDVTVLDPVIRTYGNTYCALGKRGKVLGKRGCFSEGDWKAEVFSRCVLVGSSMAVPGVEVARDRMGFIQQTIESRRYPCEGCVHRLDLYKVLKVGEEYHGITTWTCIHICRSCHLCLCQDCFQNSIQRYCGCDLCYWADDYQLPFSVDTPPDGARRTLLARYLNAVDLADHVLFLGFSCRARFVSTTAWKKILFPSPHSEYTSGFFSEWDAVLLMKTFPLVVTQFGELFFLTFDSNGSPMIREISFWRKFLR